MGYDDWVKCKGLKYRAEGISKESKMRKMGYAALWTSSAIVYFALGGIHIERAINAGRINSTFGDKIDTIKSIQHIDMQMPYAYDTCHIPDFIKAPDVSDEKLQNLHSQTLQWCKESKSDC